MNKPYKRNYQPDTRQWFGATATVKIMNERAMTAAKKSKSA